MSKRELVENEVLNNIEMVENKKAKSGLKRIFLGLSNINKKTAKIGEFKCEEMMMLLFIANLIKEYKQEDFSWESMTRNQNIDKRIFLEERISLVEKILNKQQIKIWRDDTREIGGMFYANTLNIIYSDVVANEKITRFFKAKKRKQKGANIEGIFNNYPKSVKLSYMIVCRYGKLKKYININCNTDNELLKQIYVDFYNKYNVNGSANRELKKFFYYFSDELRNLKIKRYEEINFEIIRKIYLKLRKNKDNKEKYRIHNYVYSIFRFLMKDEKYAWMNFNLKKIEKEALQTKAIGKILNGDFKPIYYIPMEMWVSGNKFCIMPNEFLLRNSDSGNMSILFCDLEQVNIIFREIVREYIWDYDKNLRTKIASLKTLYKFLDYILEDESSQITLKKAYMYRKILEKETQNLNGLKGKLKVLRSFLKIYKKSNELDEKIFDVFSLKNLEKPKGGEVITNNDLKLIYSKFLSLEEKCENSRLYTIAFEICIYSNLRIGAILNLKRDCLKKEQRKVYINYFPKIGGREKIKVLINRKIEKLILEAIEITQIYNTEELGEYIFVKRYLRIGGGLKRIDFSNYFKKIIQSLHGRLDKKNYTVQNIRDTYMNKVCDEARENNLTFGEIKAITNDSVKTIRKYYQQRNRIELIAESMFGIMINDVNCEGEILVSEENFKLRCTKDNLGKCSKNKCNFDLAECLICNNFITFINRKNVFMEKVKECDREIQETDNKFIKEEKLYEKKLLVRYITEMIKLEEKEHVGE